MLFFNTIDIQIKNNTQKAKLLAYRPHKSQRLKCCLTQSIGVFLRINLLKILINNKMTLALYLSKLSEI